jgi:type III pantothenate kinase
VIIDLGTAVTFDVVNARGDYEGGMIVPGIMMSAESLFHKTALLPKIQEIQAPKQLIGRDTQQSILSGLFHGYGAMCNGLIDDITRQLKCKPKVIVTGGYTNLMKKYIKNRMTCIDNHLVFKGIYLLSQL